MLEQTLAPMINPLNGALYPLVNRVLRDEEDIGIPQPWLKAAKHETDRIGELLDGVELDNPATYTKVVDRLINAQINDGNGWENISDIVDDLGLDRLDIPRGFIASVDTSGIDPLYRCEEDRFFRMDEGVYLAVRKNAADIHIDKHVDGVRRRAFHLIRKHIWKNTPALELEVVPDKGGFGGSMQLARFNLGTTDYLGPLESLKKRAVSMQQTGERWCVLLQGKPGIGKTTFCQDVARQVGKRVLFVGKEAFDKTGNSRWMTALKLMRPEMVILDDIDYLTTNILRTRLDTLTEGRAAPALVLMTSNDMDKFPDSMKRPGRIDHIVEVDSPGEDVIDEMIAQKAAEFELEVPDRHLERLRETHLEYGPSHLREVLKRAAAWGWEDAMIWDLYKAEDE